jgi:integrase
VSKSFGPSWRAFEGSNSPIPRNESADFLEFLGLAGLGQAEAATLTWADVNLERGHFVTFRQKTRTGFAVPIFPQLRPLLERRCAQALLLKAKCSRSMTRRRRLQALVSVSNYRTIQAERFRRLFITSAIERGVDVKVIAQWQGHQDGGKLILDTLQPR